MFQKNVVRAGEGNDNHRADLPKIFQAQVYAEKGRTEGSH